MVPNKPGLVFVLALGIFSLFIIVSLSSCKNSSSMQDPITAYALRLKPGEDLKQQIQQFVKQKNIQAGWISSCAGSLTHYAIRFANQPAADTGSGHFEIVSLGGTLSVNGSHLHISISNETGQTLGGHLTDGCTVYTTAEIVILATNQFIFKREKDGTTPWEELRVEEVGR